MGGAKGGGTGWGWGNGSEEPGRRRDSGEGPRAQSSPPSSLLTAAKLVAAVGTVTLLVTVEAGWDARACGDTAELRGPAYVLGVLGGWGQSQVVWAVGTALREDPHYLPMPNSPPCPPSPGVPRITVSSRPHDNTAALTRSRPRLCGHDAVHSVMATGQQRGALYLRPQDSYTWHATVAQLLPQPATREARDRWSKARPRGPGSLDAGNTWAVLATGRVLRGPAAAWTSLLCTPLSSLT